MSDVVIYSFMSFMALFLCIGLLSVRKRKKSPEDYLLASRDISPIFAGISAAASTASGFGFIGFIGFGYAMGLSGVWFIFGIIAGSLLGFGYTARRFRILSQRNKCVSYTEFLSARVQGRTALYPFVLGVLGIVALTLYATAQFTSGSKALHVLFGWDYRAGALLGAFIVVVYCWAGGIRASIWTDVAQMSVMYAAMFILMFVSLQELGGLSGLYDGLLAIDPKLVQILPTQNPFGPLLFIAGCLSVGLSFLGFPHVMVRFMTLKTPRQTKQAIGWFELSYGSFYITAYIVALCTRVLLPDVGTFDKELALPTLASNMLPDILVGVILAGIFAGTISTADSLILSSTASLSRDIFPERKDSYSFMKLGTIGFTACALILSISGNKNVFDLVMFAIALMGAGFAPLVLVQVMSWHLSQNVALLMVVSGVSASIAWRIMGYHVHVFDSLAGMFVALCVYSVARMYGYGLSKTSK